MDPREGRETALLGKLVPSRATREKELDVVPNAFLEMITDGIVAGTWADPFPITSKDAFDSFGLERVLPSNDNKHKALSTVLSFALF